MARVIMARDSKGPLYSRWAWFLQTKSAFLIIMNDFPHFVCQRNSCLSLEETKKQKNLKAP